MIRVVVMRPGETPEVRGLVEPAMDPETATLADWREHGVRVGRELRSIVGGWLEAVPIGSALPPDTIVYCDEEGKLKDGLQPSFSIPGDVVCGTVVATGLDDEGDTRSLTEDEAAAICRLLTTLRSFGGVS